MDEATQNKVKEVASQINELLKANKLAMIPTISFQVVADEVATTSKSPLSPEAEALLVPPAPTIAAPDGKSDVLDAADFMQP